MAPPRGRDPEVEARFDLAAAYLEMGLVDDAISELELVLVAAPTHARALEMLARARGGPPDEAA